MDSVGVAFAKEGTNYPLHTGHANGRGRGVLHMGHEGRTNPHRSGLLPQTARRHKSDRLDPQLSGEQTVSI